MDSYHTQNYSNDADFPFAFAKKMLYLPAVWLVIMWTVFILDNQMFKAFIDLVVAAWHVLFLCRILHPNKLVCKEKDDNDMLSTENEEMKQMIHENELFDKVVLTDDDKILEETCTDDTDNKTELTECKRDAVRMQIEQEKWESVKEEVLTIISKRYLEPSLKRIEVVRDVSAMNHTLAGTFITEVGFYRLVNAFRVRHYERLMANRMPQHLQCQCCQTGTQDRQHL